MKKIAFVTALIIFSVIPVFSWGDHYLITDYAMQHPAARFTNEKVKVESLESFLKAEKQNLKVLFEQYYVFLKERGSKRFKPMRFDPQNPTEKEFLRAARLNPNYHFSLVQRALPGQKLEGKKVAAKKVSVYLAEGRPDAEFVDVAGKKVTIRSILSTFSDEPDWGFDHELWGISEYGYGEQPYGKPKGESSKAPFHMQFLHENFLVKMFASHILQGMMLDRIEMFLRLAKLAHETGHPYWAYRFSAQAMHYIEDLAQPYHAKAVPYAGFWYYTNFIFSFGIIGDSKADIQRKTTQLVANRHFAYEDFVSIALEKSYTEPTPLYKRLVAYLYRDGAAYNVKSAKELMEEVSDIAVDHASDTDEAIVETFGEKLTEDPEYDLETDPNYDMNKILPTLNKEKSEEILEATGADFENTGKAARSILKILQLMPE